MGSTTRTIVLIRPKVSGGVGVFAHYFEKALRELGLEYKKVTVSGTACFDRILASTLIAELLHKLDPDTVVIALSNAIPAPRILLKVKKWITYIHCPEPLARYRLSKVMYYIFKNRISKVARDNLLYKLVLVANSFFTKLLIEKYWEWHEQICVLHPCIDDCIICKSSERIDKHPLLVTTLTRIHPTKNIEIVLKVAEKLQEFTFIIMGVVQDFVYYRWLLEFVRKHELKNVYIITNVDEHSKLRLLTFSQYYLHPTLWENFGIAVVEALARGAMPIVYKFSGSYVDVLECGKYGLGFSTVRDIIDGLVSRPKLSTGLLIGQARKFSYSMFRARLAKLLQELEIL